MSGKSRGGSLPAAASSKAKVAAAVTGGTVAVGSAAGSGIAGEEFQNAARPVTDPVVNTAPMLSPILWALAVAFVLLVCVAVVVKA